MSTPVNDLALDRPPPRKGGPVGVAQLLLGWVNAVAAVLSAIAIGIAGLVLSWAATARYVFHLASDWQDEMAIFLLVGATFMAAAWVQSRRGHVGIQALATILPPRLDGARRYLSDLITLLFCGFYAWKSWSLLIDAVREDQVSNSAWGAPLWIPYGCMALGMSLLTLQLLLQGITFEAMEPQETSAH